MSSPRVLFWIRRRSAPYGGDLVALEQTAAALRERGVTCDISDDPARPLDGYDLVHLYNLTDATAAIVYVAAAVEADKPLVVTPIYWRHAQWLTTRRAADSAAHPEFFLGSPSPAEHAASQLVLERSEELAQAAHQLALDCAARIFTLSDAEGILLQEDFHAAPDKLCVTYNGADAAFAQGDAARFEREFGLKDFILSAARIEERKNTIGVVRAWRAESVPLVLAGHAPVPAYLELCQREAGPNIHFVGALTPAQMADAYAAARVHVLASWWEEGGLAALEAGLAGCSLVMTQNSPAREYFGDACWLCDPADPQSIGAALRAAYAAPRPSALASGIREQFTWGRAADVLLASYQELLAAPETARPRAEAVVWMRAAAAAAELLHLRQEYLQTLEARSRANAAWAQELETIVGFRNAERERLLNLPFARALSERRRKS